MRKFSSRFIMLCFICFLTLGCNGASHSVKKTAYCENGELVDGNKCRQITYGKVKYTCEKDEKQKDDKCEKVVFEIDAKKGASSCPAGFYLYENDMCISEEVVEQEKINTCPVPVEGEQIEEVGGKCVKTICTEKEADGKCKKEEKNEVDKVETQKCPDGTRYIYKACRKYKYINKKYSCDKGTLNGKKCQITDLVDAKVVCEDGFTPNQESKTCEKIQDSDALYR